MKKLLFFILVLFATIGQSTIKNIDVKRTLDISSQVVKHVVEVTISNKGKDPVSNVHLCLPKDQASHVSLFTVVDSEKQKLQVEKDTEKNGVVFYSVTLSTPLAPAATENLRIKAIFTHLLVPFPTHITQSERQLVKYKDNVYFFTPYETEKQATIVKLASSSIQYNSDKPPTSVKESTINYGPYSNIPPFSFSELLVHYENNKPFLTVSSSTRYIEISHWGNAAFEDWFEVRHDGAKLRGSFSRYEYQINPQANGQAAIKSMVMFLPGNAEEVYYRDDIGNVTTSHLSLRKRRDHAIQHLELFPRFPLFGGWKTDFYMGYNVPLGEFMFIDENGFFVLNATIGPDFQAPTVFDVHDVHVILPEGASDIELRVPFPYRNETRYKHYTYLDIGGRPVIKFELENVVNEHVVRYFQVSYRFSSLSLFREPLLLIFSYFVFLMIIMFVLRFRLSILPAKTVRPGTTKLIDNLTKVLNLFSQRDALLSVEPDKGAKTVKLSQNKNYLQISNLISTTQAEIYKLDDAIAGKVTFLDKKQREKAALVDTVRDLLSQKNKASLSATQEKNLEDLDRKIEALDAEIQETVDELREYLE